MASVPLVQWSKPALVAGALGAAFVVTSGAFFVETLFQTPPPAHRMMVETTGRASPQGAQESAAIAPARAEGSSPADCQTQTWPHIARPCLPSERGARGVRMITTDKLSEPAISVIEKPPANVIHQMPPPPVSRPRSSLVAANTASPPLSGSALTALAFAGRFQGLPATEKFELAAATPAAAAVSTQSESKPSKSAAQKPAVQQQAKQKNRRQIVRATDKRKSKSTAVASRDDNANAANRNSFGSAPSGFPSGGPFGALFGSRANQ